MVETKISLCKKCYVNEFQVVNHFQSFQIKDASFQNDHFEQE
jgi:hypothetical protein